MKNLKALLVSAVLIFFISLHRAYALIPKVAVVNNTDSVRDNKTPETYLRLNEISSRAARHFEKNFPGVAKRRWMRTPAGYLVKFIQDDIHTHVYFDKKGRVVLQTRYFNDRNMPASVKRTLLRYYPGYNIGVVTEATTIHATFYHIHIQNEHSVKTIRVYDSVAELINDNEI